jgi:hypothetical protein
VLTIRHRHGEQRVCWGYGRWERGGGAAMAGSASFTGVPDGGTARTTVAASGAWIDERTYAAQLWWDQTAYGRRLTTRFDTDTVTVEQEQNVSFGPTARASLEGTHATP